MKRRHLIEISPPKDRQYRYMVVFTDTVADVGMAFFDEPTCRFIANTEDETIEYVMKYRNPEPLQLSLW